MNKERVSEYTIEKELKSVLANQSEPTIILRAEEGVPIEDAVLDGRLRIKITIKWFWLWGPIDMSVLDTEHKRKSMLLTVVLHVIILLLLFYVGMKYLDPPRKRDCC